MSEVVKFVKRGVNEPQDVLAFKTDLKMFMNFLDTVDIQTSRWAMTNIYLDQTSVNFVSHYLDSLFESAKKHCQDIYNTKYKSVGLINHTLYHSVMGYLDWSETMETPVFEFNIMTPLHDLTFTAVMLSEKQTIITNITFAGIGLVGRLTSHISSLIASNEVEGYLLSGGSASIPEIKDSELNFGFYHYGFSRPEDNVSKIQLIKKNKNQDEFYEYITDILYADDFILLPMEVQYLVAKHSKLKKPVTIHPHGDLFLAGVLPMTYMDRELVFDIYTANEIHTLHFNKETGVWEIELLGERTDGAFLDFIEGKLNQLELRGVMWETDGATFWYTLPFNYKGEEGMVRWDRMDGEGGTVAIVSLMGAPVKLADFHFRTVLTTTAITTLLDSNTGLFDDILDGINDFIE